MTLRQMIMGMGTAILLAACSATYTNHGYTPSESELAEVIVGVDTRDSLTETLGPPSTGGVIRDDAWYYMSEQRKHWGPRAPQPIERELVAISFNPSGTVSNIERFGLEDGQVVTLSRRITETSIRDFSLIQQILRNFGRINIGEALSN